MAGQISFEIITPEGLKFQAEVYAVVLPTAQGDIGILPHHIPLITIVTAGVITIRRREADEEDAREHLATAGGFVEIDGKRVRLLADTAERAEDIDELRVQAALERAREMKKNAKDQVALADAVALIEQSMARLKIAEIKRRRISRGR
ncbi:MAG: ATP synthase F1 subunit epsilon [Candidatus Andersenbacteria bacterium]